MNREIKFRGKTTKAKEWVYGYAVKRGSEWHIDYETVDWKSTPPLGKIEYHKVRVDEKTVGQFTGLMDENGREIYEGDIIKFGYHHNNEEEKDISPIAWYGDSEWQYPAFDFDGGHIKHHYFEGNVLSEVIGSSMYYHEVIGNIYENGELLETK